MGIANPITTPPVKDTISYVPMIGLPNALRITSHVVRHIMKTKAVPATISMNLLRR
jgi:hypothetical protein